MERAWDRKHPFVELTPDELVARLHVALPGAAIRAIQPLDAGLRNTSYRLDLDAPPSPVVLRLYVADPAACCREAGVLTSLGLEGRVSAPEVLFADGDAAPPFAILTWIEGVDLDTVLRTADDPAQLELARACGAALAAIHEVRFPQAGFLGPALRVVEPLPSWASFLESAVRGPAGERLGAELADALRRVVRERERELDQLFVDAALVQADYKPWNLLARSSGGGWELAGVLDWEFAFAGPGLFDFATFLRDESSRAAGFGDAFADAYRTAGGVLPPDWRELARLLDLVNLCQLAEQGGPRQVADVRRLVGETLLPPVGGTSVGLPQVARRRHRTGGPAGVDASSDNMDLSY